MKDAGERSARKRQAMEQTTSARARAHRPVERTCVITCVWFEKRGGFPVRWGGLGGAVGGLMCK